MSSDLIDHLYAALALSDAVLQFWISITFALIVGVHFVGSRLSGAMYRLMAGLYALVSVITLARYLGVSFQLIHYVGVLRSHGEWHSPWILQAIAGYGTFFLIVFGTIATLYFMSSIRKNPSTGA